MVSFAISEEETQVRLDKALVSRFPDHSRTYFHYLIKEQSVLLNGNPCKKRDALKKGDLITIHFLPTPELSAEPEHIPLDILYEDDIVIAVNKPAHMVVHPAPGHPNQTFVNALLFHCRSIKELDPLRPGIVHRIDKETSGILLAAKTKESHRALVQQFSERRIKKTYLAICVGTPPEGLVDAPLKRHPVHRKEMSVQSNGKEAQSIIHVKNASRELSLVEIDILTGRTHQIRVHLQHLKTPILGDSTYGYPSWNKKFNVNRQLLHAHKIRFIHPLTQNPIDLVAPIPTDMLFFIEQHFPKQPKL